MNKIVDNDNKRAKIEAIKQRSRLKKFKPLKKFKQSFINLKNLTTSELIEKARYFVAKQSTKVIITATLLAAASPAIARGNFDSSGLKLVDGENSKDKIENTVGVAKNDVADLNVTADMVADYLLEKGELTIDKFNISDYEFSKEDLEMLIPSENAERLFTYAKENSLPKGTKIKGQTYCLGYGKTALSNTVGINLETGRHASSALPVLRKNDNFVEINTKYENNLYLSRGSIYVLEPGRGYLSGHFGIVGDGIDCGHVTYNARTSPYNSDRTKCYGKSHAFVFKDTKVRAELAKKWFENGRLKPEVELTVAKDLRRENMSAVLANMSTQMPEIKVDMPTIEVEGISIVKKEIKIASKDNDRILKAKRAGRDS